MRSKQSASYICTCTHHESRSNCSFSLSLCFATSTSLYHSLSLPLSLQTHACLRSMVYRGGLFHELRHLSVGDRIPPRRLAPPFFPQRPNHRSRRPWLSGCVLAGCVVVVFCKVEVLDESEFICIDTHIWGGDYFRSLYLPNWNLPHTLKYQISARILLPSGTQNEERDIRHLTIAVLSRSKILLKRLHPCKSCWYGMEYED